MFVFLPCHSVATWQFVDLCLYRHATLPIGFPRRISRLVVGYYLEEHEPNLLLKRYLLCSLMGALTEDQFTLTTCVSGDNDGFAPVEQLPDHSQLPDDAGIILIDLALPHLTGNKFELLWQYGQMFPVEAGEAVAFGMASPTRCPNAHVTAYPSPIRYPSFHWRAPTMDAMPCATLGFSAMITFIYIILYSSCDG